MVNTKNLLAAAGISFGTAYALQCGNKDVAPAELPALPALMPRQAGNVTMKPVDVYFHIASTEANRDRITDDIAAEQFDFMHDTYLVYNFNLTLINTTRIVDDVIGGGFYSDDSTISDENYTAYSAYLTSQHRGGYDSLNMYFFSDLLPSLGGQCDLPRAGVEEGSPELYLDGCVVNGDTMPGLRSRDPDGTGDDAVREGHIAVHESGHWFGLLHTFTGRACDPFNDQVDDTPAQAGGSSGCPVGRDSCPDSEGLDPVHNFMDYSDDSCTTEFTPGQMARMHQQFDVYRRWTG